MELSREDKATLAWLRQQADRAQEEAIKGDDPWAKHTAQYARIALSSFVTRLRQAGHEI